MHLVKNRTIINREIIAMLLKAFTYAVQPLTVHKHLTPDHLASAADHAAETYASQNPEDRQLKSAMNIGALRGAALGRRVLGPATSAVDAVFGAKLTLAPGLGGGIAPKMLNAPFESFTLLVGRRIDRVGGAAGAVLVPHLSALLGIRALSAAEGRTIGICATQMATSLALTPSTFAASVGTQCSYWTSAGFKLATTAPFALAGAAAGAVLHRLYEASIEVLQDLGSRGERNEETFASMESTSSIPDAYFFLSEDRFGIDLRELMKFVEARGDLVNPHTNTSFSASDIERLEQAMPSAFGPMSHVRLSEHSLLNHALWVKHFDGLVHIAHQLGQSGAGSAGHRAQGYESFKNLLMTGDNIEAHALKLFAETNTETPWRILLEQISHDKDAAQHTAAVLLKMCMLIGIIQISRDMPHDSASAALGHLGAILGKEKRAQNVFLGLRNPWMAKMSLSAEELDFVRHPQTPQ